MFEAERISESNGKQELRARAMAARARLSPQERAEASRAAAERMAGLPAFARARTVALYAPLGAEMDTAEIGRCALAAGKAVVFPRAVPGERRLAFAACRMDETVPGPLGAREPPPGAPAVALAGIELVIVPLVAFDASARRLGRGGGHYDATLAALPRSTARVGLAFEVQRVPEVPAEPHDALLDAVVTERRVLLPP